MSAEPKLGISGRLAKTFLRSKLTPLLVMAALVAGVAAAWLTPREEEPQIVVPMVDVQVGYPGASAKEVETQVTNPLERRLWGIPGVEYLYSTSRSGGALITVRFQVNEPLEPSLVKVKQELDAHPELIPPGAMKPTVNLLSIDDVPFMTLTLHGGNLPAGVLRKLGDTVALGISEVPQTAQVQVVGGARRVVRVEPEPDRLRTLKLTVAQLGQAISQANAQLPAGSLVSSGTAIEVQADGFLRSASALRKLVVAERDGRPVYLGDVAKVTDGPEPEPAIVLTSVKGGGFEQAVTIQVAKRKGANATKLADKVLEKVDTLRGSVIPADVQTQVTRNYGKTAGEKSNELIEHLLIATLSVIALILIAMGWRSALVVGVAVPVTLALTLLISYLLGYTLNRVTLFALIFSIGILVDDAIVVVENIHRHLHLPGKRPSFAQAVVAAVDEVGNPTILATLAVIAAILPMAFVRGLMGPYMRPIPVGASFAMIFSLVIAFVVSPWAALKVFKGEAHKKAKKGGATLELSEAEDVPPEPGEDHASVQPEIVKETRLTRAYRKVMRSLLSSGKARLGFLALVLVLLGGSFALVGTGLVKVKMLPFDNKSEFQVQLDLPAGTARQDAVATGEKLARRLMTEPEVRSVQLYSGKAAPFTFVGLVRHSFLRDRPEQVDLSVELSDKGDRKAQSHAIVTRIRPQLESLLKGTGARMKLVEIPPGPPVLDTLVAEVYGPSQKARDGYAQKVEQAFRTTGGVVDVDSTLVPKGPKTYLSLDAEKASLHGVVPQDVVRTLSLAGAGQTLGNLHVDRSLIPVPINLQLSEADRTRLPDLLTLEVPGARGPVPLGELVSVRSTRDDEDINHKNGVPVSYVFGDLAGEIESPVYALAALNQKLDQATTQVVPRFGLTQPSDTEQLAMKWDGEWHITLEVFRDLGLAFAAVLILIYFLVVGWFESFTTPLAILVPIPLSLIGILPAHALWGAFFTATSMIGFIAGAGIIVRNSIILVDFIELKLREGMPLAAAVEEAGVVRFRPMLLTAAAVLVGSAVMLADPIFQGLAISLMAGEVAATLLSRMAVPVLYYLIARRGRAAQLQREGLPLTGEDAANDEPGTAVHPLVPRSVS
jgi:multidrug efflux pump subunit AcrB